MTTKEKIYNVIKNHKKCELFGIIQIVPIHKISALKILIQLKNEDCIKIQKGKTITDEYGFKHIDKNAIIFKLAKDSMYKQLTLL